MWGDTGTDRTWWVEGLCEQFDDGREEVEGDEDNGRKIGSRDSPGFPAGTAMEFMGLAGDDIRKFWALNVELATLIEL